MLRSGGKIPRFDSLVKRAAGLGLRCLAGLWLFGAAVRLVTDFSWYNALGYLRAWRGLVLLQTEIFAAFMVVALLLGAPVLRAALYPAGKGNAVPPPSLEPLAGPLGRLDSWRRSIPRPLLWLTVGVAAFLAWNLAGHADEWLLFRYAAQWGYAEPHTGLDASLWVFKLPLLNRWLTALWIYSLMLLLALALGGGLRALPQVLTRRPAMPRELIRVVRLLGAWLLLLRAAGYGLGALSAVALMQPDSHAWWLVRATSGLGAGGCLVLAVLLLVRQPAFAASQPGAFRNRHSLNSTFALLLLAALWGPPLVLHLMGPWAEMAGRTDNRALPAAVHAAWGPVEPHASPAVHLGEAPWPVWDEAVLLQANPSARFLDKSITVWQRATLEWDGTWKMLLAGIPTVSTLDTDPRTVGETNSQVFVEGAPGRVSLASGTAGGMGTVVPVNAAQVSAGTESPVFGLTAGTALLAKSADESASTGAPYRSLLWRLAWGWRLHDLFLMYGNGDASALLAYRSAEQRAQRLLPFLKPCGPPRAVHVGSRILWSLDLASVSSQFPGVPAVPSGPLEGANVARHAVKMLVDSGTGAVTFYAAPASQVTPDPLLRAWMRAFPGMIRPAEERPAGRAAEPYPASLLIARAWQETGGSNGSAFAEPYLLGGTDRGPSGGATVYTATWANSGDSGFSWLAADGAGRLQSVRGHGQVEAVRILLANSFAQLDAQLEAGRGTRPDGSIGVREGQRGGLPVAEQGYRPDARFGARLGSGAEQPGQTVLWPQNDVSGGWMVARSVFAAANASDPGNLRAVGVADLASRLTDSPQRVGVATTLEGALASRDRSMGPVVAVAPGLGRAELVRRSLEANEAISNDFQQGNLGDIGRQLTAQRLWLREYLRSSGPGKARHEP